MMHSTPSEAAREQAYRRLHTLEVSRRVAFLGKHRMLNCAQALLRLQAGGMSRLEALREVRMQRKLFYVQFIEVAYFPVFQWAHVQLRRGIADVLGILAGKSKWHVALWFVEENVFLRRRRPIDLLDAAPEAVVAAAMKEFPVSSRSH